ncbi:Rz1-like spanin outer membrane subunit [Pseudomonas sp. SID14000]|uniref:Rz1-like spanin outer membrane subunit n=1 Tax=Pseudomonas sp. SID14000 TaxID=1986221 RepID=UPI0034D342D2
MRLPSDTSRSRRKALRLLPALSVLCMTLVTGCGSNLPTPKSPQSQVTVDASLMAKPSYQTDLLNFLLDKPEKLTSK